MKALLAALLLVSSSAMAQNDVSYSRSSDELQIDFISWCEENNVMGQDQQGNNYVRANCSEQGLTCKTYSSYRHHRTIYTAACAAK